MNEQWIEVMRLAEKYGFLWFCYGGVAMLTTHEEQEKARQEQEKEKSPLKAD